MLLINLRPKGRRCCFYKTRTTRLPRGSKEVNRAKKVKAFIKAPLAIGNAR